MAALNHREPDRVPIDFSGHRSSGISALLYPKLRKLLGLPPAPVRVYDPIQQLAIVAADILDRFGVDTLELGRGFALEDRHWREWPLPDALAECLWTAVGSPPGPLAAGEEGVRLLRDGSQALRRRCTGSISNRATPGCGDGPKNSPS